VIPSAIATRLYVSLQESDWAKRVAAGANLEVPSQQQTKIAPYVLHATEEHNRLVIELRPRAGRWNPFVILVPDAQRERLLTVGFGPAGRPPAISLVLGTTEVEAEGRYKGLQIEKFC
jgi:hypothetical protein